VSKRREKRTIDVNYLHLWTRIIRHSLSSNMSIVACLHARYVTPDLRKNRRFELQVGLRWHCMGKDSKKPSDPAKNLM
jgi:hypothetical protein